MSVNQQHLVKQISTSNMSKVIQNLHQSVYKFLHFVSRADVTNPESLLLFNKFAITILCQIRKCELDGCTKEEIFRIIEPVRQFLRQSIFIKRIQEWPRGYAGDYETIECICGFKNQCEPGSVGYFIENWALNLPIVQQHRNKIIHQAKIIKEVVRKDNNPKTIGILGCGGCADLRSIDDQIAPFNPVIVLNDMDKDALAFSQKECSQFKNLHLINNNVLKALRGMSKYGEYDLILAGGLLDYFDIERTSKIISLSLRLLKPDGKLFFTNIAEGNPFRGCMEYYASWTLIEKSAEDLIRACVAAGAKRDQLVLKREESLLTYVMTVHGGITEK